MDYEFKTAFIIKNEMNLFNNKSILLSEGLLVPFLKLLPLGEEKSELLNWFDLLMSASGRKAEIPNIINIVRVPNNLDPTLRKKLQIIQKFRPGQLILVRTFNKIFPSIRQRLCEYYYLDKTLNMKKDSYDI